MISTTGAASRRARAVVLAVLLGDVAWAAVLAGWLVAPGGALGWAAVVAVLAVHAVLHVLVLRAAVTPWLEERTRTLLATGLLAVTAAAWPVLTTWAGPGDEPWAWLLGFTLGALVALRPWAALVGAIVGAALLVVGEGVWGSSVRDGLVFAAVAATAAGGLALLVVWMLRVLVAAEDGQAAEARLAVVEERLRVSRDLHDVLGQRLGLIALRAELAGDTQLQELVARTLREVRAAVHGYGTVDLDEQLRGAELVLASAGVRTEVRTSGAPVSAAGSQLLAAAVREAVTNVLRHSAATRCGIVLEADASAVRLTVTNDGIGPSTAPAGTGPSAPDSAAAPAGTGLSGLAERARLTGARLHTERDGAEFRLVVEVPTGAGG